MENKLSLKRTKYFEEKTAKKIKIINEIESCEGHERIESITSNGNQDRYLMQTNQNAGFKISPRVCKFPTICENVKSEPIEEEKFVCEICKKDLTHWNVQRRTQHINRCADEQLEANKIPPLVCPFCRKDVPKEKKMTHLKICARSKGVTDSTKLLELSHEMDRQAEKMKALGISTAVMPKPKPKTVTRFKGLSKLDPDLQMALAMSISTKEENDRKLEAELIELGIPVPMSNKQSVSSGRRKKISAEEFLPVLITRTPKEREELLQIKISQILDEAEDDDEILTLDQVMGTESKSPSNSKRTSTKISLLWRKTSCPDVVFNKSLFYVKELRSLISPCKIPVASKRKTVSQIPGRGLTQIPVIRNEHTKDLEKSLFNDDNQQFEEIYSQGQIVNSSGFFAKQFSTEEVNHLDYLVTDYGCMVGNSELSDVNIRTKDGDIISAHRFVFLARCLPLYEETKKLNIRTPILDWSMVSSKTAKTFLTFLYNSQLITDDETIYKELKILANRYNVNHLLNQIPQVTETPQEIRKNSSPVLEEIEKKENNIASSFLLEEMNNGEGNEIISSPVYEDCMSPELLPLEDSDQYEDDVLDNGDCCTSPIIHSQFPKKTNSLCDISQEDMIVEESVFNEKSLKSILHFDPETSTPIRSVVTTRKERFSSLSSIKNQSISDEDNEIEAVMSNTSNVSQSVKDNLNRDDIMQDVYDCFINSSFGDPISSSDEEDKIVAINSSQIISSCTQKSPVEVKKLQKQNYENDYSDDSIQCLQNDDLDQIPENYKNCQENSPRLTDHKSLRLCSSQPLSFHKSGSELLDNDPWKDFYDGGCDDGVFNDEFSRNLIPRPSSITPIDKPLDTDYNPLISNTPILPLAERIKKFRNYQEEDKQINSTLPILKTTDNLNNFQQIQIDVVESTKEANVKVNAKKKPAVRRRKKISLSQPAVNVNITPKPNFVDMNASLLKKQLKKFGLRHLPNKKAIQILEHIYEGTHPLITDSEHENSTINKTVQPNDNLNVTCSEDELSGSQSDLLNESQEILEETCFLEESPSQPTDSITEAFKNFIKGKPDIYRKVLLYEPIKLDELHSQIKEHGLKINLPTLKELLDKECITFTVPRERPKQQGRRKLRK